MIRSGRCQCGAVAYEVEGESEPVAVCHCRQCRTWSGHLWASSAAPMARFRLQQQRGLRWFRSSPGARRGFCAECGSSLFWQAEPDRICFSAGSLDQPTGLEMARELFPDFAGDYYPHPSGRGQRDGESPEPAASGRLAGGCLCGSVQVRLQGPVGDITACHCSQCRRLSGHYAASFDLDEAQIEISGGAHLAVYRTPAGSARGFCARCGSSLWFRAAEGGFSVEAGVIAGATGGQLTSHIHVASKGDYYRLTDGVPQHAGSGD